MKRFFALVLSLCVLLVAFSSCGASSHDAKGNFPYIVNEIDAGWNIKEEQSSDSTPSTQDRKIIKTVNASVQTLSYNSFMDTLIQNVDSYGGYISKRSEREGYNARYATLVIRMPAEKLQDFMNSIGNVGTIIQLSESQNDVTEDYINLESRISVLQAEETALTTMLSNATTVQDMLLIRNQLTSVQEDLASYNAKLTYYQNAVSYSTINLDVTEVAKITPPEDPTFFEELGTTFVNSCEGVLEFFEGLAFFLFGGFPILLLIAAIGCGIFFIIRAVVKKKKAKKQNKEN